MINLNGAEVRAQREMVGLSQKKLAKKAGVSLSTIERIESGEEKPRQLETARLIAVALEVQLQDLTHQHSGSIDTLFDIARAEFIGLQTVDTPDALKRAHQALMEALTHVQPHFSNSQLRLHVEILNKLAAINNSLGERKEAQELNYLILKALDQNGKQRTWERPARLITLSCLVKLCSDIGPYSKAIRHFNDILKIAPGNFKFNNNESNDLIQLGFDSEAGRDEEGKGYIGRYWPAERFVIPHRYVGWAKVYEGNARDGFPSFEQASNINSANLDAVVGLAYCAMLLPEQENRREHYLALLDEHFCQVIDLRFHFHHAMAHAAIRRDEPAHLASIWKLKLELPPEDFESDLFERPVHLFVSARWLRIDEEISKAEASRLLSKHA